MCLQCGNIGPVGIVVCRELLSHTSAIPILSPFYAISLFSYAGMATSRFPVETILNYKEDTYLVKWVGQLGNQRTTWTTARKLFGILQRYVTQWQIWEGGGVDYTCCYNGAM